MTAADAGARKHACGSGPNGATKRPHPGRRPEPGEAPFKGSHDKKRGRPSGDALFVKINR